MIRTNPFVLAALAAALGLIFCKDQSADFNNLMGNFLVGIGCIMLIVAAQQQNLEIIAAADKKTPADKKTTPVNDIEEIRTRIKQLEAQMEITARK